MTTEMLSSLRDSRPVQRGGEATGAHAQGLDPWSRTF